MEDAKMIRAGISLATVLTFVCACGGHETPASDAQVAAAEARAERSDSVTECLESVDERYEDAISGCDDAACKASVEKEKVTWYNQCTSAP
jgi:hypothetical protein